MKRLLLSLSILFAAAALRGAEIRVKVHDVRLMRVPGATAAYAIDPSIVDVALTDGKISLTARAAGSTQIVAVTAAGPQTFAITVEQPVTATSGARAGAPVQTARAESRYSSGSAQVDNTVDVFSNDGGRQSQLHVSAIHYTDTTPGRSPNAIPSVFYRVQHGSREITLLDQLVDISPATIRSTQIRGFHLTGGPLELHAGYAASTMFDDLLLPADRR